MIGSPDWSRYDGQGRGGTHGGWKRRPAAGARWAWARPGLVRRAVLRPRLRVRHHAAVASPAGAPDVRGLVQTTLLFMAVWWVWIYTSWVTNWLDPEQTAVRLLLFALMLAGLVLSTSIPEAFGSKGLAFAGAYVFMQVGRSAVHALGAEGPKRGQLSQLPAHHLLARPIGRVLDRGRLCAGRHAPRALGGGARHRVHLAHAFGFWTPGLGASTTSDWDVEGGHLAERCGLFVIIALGESILVTGATFGKLAVDAGDRRRIPPGVRRQRGDVVDLLQHRRRARQPADRGVERSGAGRAARLHLPASAAGRRHHRRGGRRRAGAGASRPATPMPRRPPC